MQKRSQSTIIFYDTSCVFQNVLFPISQVLDTWFGKEDYMYSIDFNMEKDVPYVDKPNHLQRYGDGWQIPDYFCQLSSSLIYLQFHFLYHSNSVYTNFFHQYLFERPPDNRQFIL